MKKLISLVMGLILMAVTYPVYAAEYVIVYQDGQFVLDSENMVDEDMVWMPGDTIVQTYVLKNQSQDKVQMYLEVSASVELPDEMQEWIQISVSSKANGWKHILQPVSTDAGYLNERIEMGAFAPEQTNDLTVEITLSEEADNRCRDMMTTLEYELVAEVDESGDARPESPKPETESEDASETETEETSETETESGIVNPPDTSDLIHNPYLGLLIAGILLLIWACKGQRR